jgi:signal peptide peptidase SppA
VTQPAQDDSALEVAARLPWAISDAGLKLVLAIASRGAFFDEVRQEALAARNGEPMENTHRVTRHGANKSVASIPVRGPLFRHANLFTRASGATSYGQLRTDLQATLDDDGVKSIVLDIDSPGGEVTGVAELADAIFAARQQKQVTAYVGGTGASAAYWLASAASQVVAAPTAELGSIGVVMAYLDDSKALEARGLRQVQFVSSQSPDKRLNLDSKDGRAAMQQRVDDLANIFIAAVARNRNVTAETVLSDFGRGGVMIASRARAAAMADRIGDFESVVAELGGRSTTLISVPGATAHRENNMSKIAVALGLGVDASEEAQLAALEQLKQQRAQMQQATDQSSAAAKDLEEQKRVNARLEAELDRLSKESEARATREWHDTCDAAERAGKLTPFERDEHKALAGAERDVAARLLAKRPANRPAPPVPMDSAGSSPTPATAKGTTSEGLSAAQQEAVAAYKAANPAADDAAALTGAIVANPALFAATKEG